MSVTTLHFTQRSEAKLPTSQRTISFLNKRKSDLLLSASTTAFAHGQKHSESYVTYSFSIGWLTVFRHTSFSVRLHTYLKVKQKQKNKHCCCFTPFCCGSLKCSQARLQKQRKQRTSQEMQDLGIIYQDGKSTRHPTVKSQ